MFIFGRDSAEFGANDSTNDSSDIRRTFGRGYDKFGENRANLTGRYNYYKTRHAPDTTQEFNHGLPQSLSYRPKIGVVTSQQSRFLKVSP